MVHLSEKVLRATTLTPTGDCYAFNSFTYQNYLQKGFNSTQLGPCIKYLELFIVFLGATEQLYIHLLLHVVFDAGGAQLRK